MRTGLVLLILGLVFGAVILPAQNAIVIELNPQDREMARELHREQEILNKKWDTLKSNIIRSYLEAPMSQSSGCVVNHMLIKPEWGCAEFSFSSGFNFIVPSQNLTRLPSDDSLYEMVNGVATLIREKTEYEIRAEDGYSAWVWNNLPNSEHPK